MSLMVPPSLVEQVEKGSGLRRGLCRVHPHVAAGWARAHRVSDAVGALYSAGAAWTINGRGGKALLLCGYVSGPSFCV